MPRRGRALRSRARLLGRAGFALTGRRPRGIWPLLLLLVVLAIEIPVLCRWWSRPAPSGSLLEAGSVVAGGAMGIPDHVLSGPLAAEGGHWRLLDRTLVLGNSGGLLAVDVGEPVEARALLVQANAGNWFDVEISLDGERWRRIWEVPISREGPALRTRRRVLDPPETFRHLRILNRTSEGVAALGAVRAYAEIPEEWPLVAPAGPAPVSAFPWFTLAAVTRGKSLVALAGALLLVASWRLDRRRARSATLARAVRTLLAVTAGVSALGWWNFLQISGEDYERAYYNYWDVQHYYLGAKYAPELGYTRLYPCILTADVEAGLRDVRLQVDWIRDLTSNEFVRTRDVAADPRGCTDHFEADRWQAFQADHAKFRLLTPTGRQLQMLQDHGYNATPVWGIVGRAVGALGPLDDRILAAALALDPILLVLSFALLARTFGFRVTCGALILFGTSYSSGNWSTAGAFFRFGWLAACVAGVCCLKRERWILAGALLALAMSLRLFPGFLIGGVGLGALVQMIRERRFLPSASMLRFGTAVALAVLALASLSIAVTGDAGAWRGFLDNTIKHKATTGASSMGLAAATNLLHDTHRDGYERFRSAPDDLKRYGVNRPKQLLLLAAGAITLLLLALAVRREEPWVCAILGLCWLPFASDITFYDYCAAILFAPLLGLVPALAIPYAILIVAWAASGLVFDYTNLYLYSASSVVLLLFSLSALGCFAGSMRAPKP